MISVLMSIFEKDNPELLVDCLKSLVCQTLPIDELVLVHDGPLPNSLVQVVDAFRNVLPLREIKLPVNVGLGGALNAGLSRCGNALVARLDADDIALPDRMERQVNFLASAAEVDIVSGFAFEIDAAGVRGRIREVPTDSDAILSTLWANPIIHPAVMYRRDRILSAGSYDPKLRRRQDYELWFRCAAAGLRFANIPKPLIEYRFTPATHRRQSRGDMWRQGQIGFYGARSIDLPMWKQLACFAPFARSLLPMRMQHQAYRLMQRFDPRRS